jgi:hypothetical protein
MDTSEQTILSETPKREARRRRSIELKRPTVGRDIRNRGVRDTRGASACSQGQSGFLRAKKYREGRLGNGQSSKLLQ